MRRYELGMALTYAKGWGVSDAVDALTGNEELIFSILVS